MKNLVIYHINCVDGSAAAVAHRIAYERGQRDNGDVENALLKNEYVAMGHGLLETPDKFFEVIGDYQDITFLDFCPTQPLLSKLLADGKTVTVIDHHKDNYEMMEKHFADASNQQLRVIFSKDNKLSGATLTWLMGISGYAINTPNLLREITIHDHLFLTNVNIGSINETTITFKDPLYNLIGIRDTWNESDPEMKRRADNLHSYMDFYGIRDFEPLYAFVKNEEFVFHGASIVEAGAQIHRFKRKLCEDALKEAHQNVIPTAQGDIHLAMGICPSGQGSQFGQSWREMNPGKKTIAVALFIGFGRMSIVVGFRSNGIAALPLAQSFTGGGGHDNACGCRLTNVAIPYEHISNGTTDALEWMVHEIESRIVDLYGKAEIQNAG